jgi:DNA-binding transcriptional ArsR family regulator
MAADSEILRRLIAIDHKTDSMHDSLAWLVRASPGLKSELVAAFGSGKRRVQVYLSLDGSRNVNEVAAHLRMKAPNVTAELRWLKKHRLIDLGDIGGRGAVYRKKFFDSVIGLSDDLAEKFSLTSDGRNAASATAAVRRRS